MGGGGGSSTHTKKAQCRQVKQIFIKENRSLFSQFPPVAVALPFTSSVEITIIINDAVYMVLIFFSFFLF